MHFIAAKKISCLRPCRHFSHRAFTSPALLIFIFLLVVCRSAAAQNGGEADKPLPNENYKIGPGDVLRVTVFKQSLLSADGVRVGNDGTIRLPMLEADVPAACLTESEMSSLLVARYKKYLLNPQITVVVTQFNANPVAFVGAVVSPGRFQLQRPVRLLELLTMVNGPAPNAGKIVQIIRNPMILKCGQILPADEKIVLADEAPVQEVVSLPLAEVLKGTDSFNPFVQAGDIVRVAEAEIEQAFIIGSVRSALTVNLKEPVTLSKAIAMAGGAAPGARIEKIKISRQPTGSLSKTEIVVNLKEINNHSRDDVMLKPNDIVEVPGASGTQKFLKDIFRNVIPVVTRLPVIIP